MPAGDDLASKEANTCFGDMLARGPDISSNAINVMLDLHEAVLSFQLSSFLKPPKTRSRIYFTEEII